MLHASELYDEAANGALAKLGVKIDKMSLDLETMHGQRKDAVKQLTGGIEYLFKKNKVEWLKGHASFQSANSVKVGDRTVTAKNIVIATGSSVTPLPGVAIDQKVIVDSTGALELEKVPGHMVVIGGGVIGLELGSVWRRLGSKVTVVEYLDQILPGMDGEVRKEANKILKKQGIEFKLSTKVTKVEAGKKGATLTIEPAAQVVSGPLSSAAVTDASADLAVAPALATVVVWAPAAIWSTVVLALALSCWLVDGYLAGRRQTLRAMELYAERFVEEFERPLLQPHLSRRPIQSRVRFKPGRARFDVLLAPDAGLRYPNLTDHKKNVMYDVVRIQQALSEHAFVSSRPYARGRWVVVPFRFRVGTREAGGRCDSFS